jgi:hypothetical protein
MTNAVTNNIPIVSLTILDPFTHPKANFAQMKVQRPIRLCNKIAFARWRINQRQSNSKKFDDFAFHIRPPTRYAHDPASNHLAIYALPLLAAAITPHQQAGGTQLGHAGKAALYHR